MSETDARSLANNPHVDYVEQDQRVTLAAAQSPTPSWGLDRIDQRSLPRDTTYGYDPNGGAGVHAYIIDTGIRKSQSDFGGRVSYGFNFIEDGQSPTDAGDCEGHGTMVAGVVGGTAYGVAKKVQLVAVRVFGCNANSDATSIQDGINWAMNDVKAHRANGPWPAVINLSAASTCRDAANQPTPCPAGATLAIVNAENNAIAAGITVVAAAGNDNADASSDAFLNAGQVIAVGATDVTDARWVSSGTLGSNFGNRVDLWAPGASITSDYPFDGSHTPSDTGFATADGTSLAAPHVTGAVALLLGTPQYANASPADIKAQLLANATVGPLANLGSGSHNRLLFIPSGPTSVALARGQDGRLALFGVTPDGLLRSRSQQTVGSFDWTSWTTSTAKGWSSLAAEPNDDKTLVLAASTATSAVFHRQQAPTAANWFNWHLDGLCSSIALAANNDGRLEMACVNPQGALFSRRQNALNSADWGAWNQITLPAGVILRSITADRDVPDGRIELAGVDAAGHVWHTAQTAADATAWNPMVAFGGPLMNEVALARNSTDNTLEMIGTDGSGHISVRRQTSAGSAVWSDWSPLPGMALRHIAVETNTGGRILVVGVDSSGGIWQASQAAAGSDLFGSWTSIPDGPLRS